MNRPFHFPGFTLLILAACAAPADAPPAEGMAESASEAVPAPGTTAAKVAEAMLGAPMRISSAATIMDWPATPDGEMTELRAGSNGWTCFPSSPQGVTSAIADPMCLDQTWLEFAEAWTTHTPPAITRVGIGYMLAGDAGASATDPFAMEKTADNGWVVSPPHLMIIAPDPGALEGLPSTPDGGGPWVMWSGSPWAHVMVPVQEGN